MRSPTGWRVRRLRLQRGCACGPPINGLYGASDTALDPQGPQAGSPHMIRGGDWITHALFCRSAHRAILIDPFMSHDWPGFRAVLPPGKP